MKIAAFEMAGRKVLCSIGEGGEARVIADRDTFWKAPDLGPAGTGEIISTAGLKEHPALPAGAKVICIGLNYRKHAEETGAPIPTVPVVFARWSSTLACDGDAVPCIEEKFDYEGELGVVIGKRMFRVSAEQAMAGIFGYAAFNDLSARSFQMQTPQWIMGKNSPSSGPMSPIVTADEAGDPAAGLRLTTRVNGVIRQDSTTSDMIFTVPDLIAHLSQTIQLEPGDLIITGTPSGVGLATGKYLVPGDVVEVEIERIGRVTTPIVENMPSVC